MAGDNRLHAYPRPSVAVDIAIMTTFKSDAAGEPGRLHVLVVPEKSGGQALPGRFLRERQTVAESVADVLRVKAGLGGVRAEPRLLRVFDDPERDPRGWTLSLAHALALPSGRLRESRGTLVGVTRSGRLESGQSLAYDHDAIVIEAAAAIRDRYERRPDPDGLLERPFTVTELRGIHEAVIGERLLKDTFRRRMEPQLEPLVDGDGRSVLRSDGGRPAQVYQRASRAEVSGLVNRRLLLPRAGH
jgi:8-oxo-dGTP diphosphatase